MLKIVPDWRESWTWLSVNIPTVNAAMIGAWLSLPEEFKQAFPAEWMLSCAAGLVVLGVAGRLIDQKKAA